jgi:hypothetical protein
MGALAKLTEKLLNYDFLKLTAVKTLLIGVVTVILPIVLYNTAIKLTFAFANWSLGYIATSGMSPVVVQISGFGAWCGTRLNLADCLSIILAAVAVRFVLNIVRR